MTLQEIGDRPRFVFNATNVASGALVRISKRYLADWRVGRIEQPELELAVVVAASSAFPPWLGPYPVALDGQEWLTERGNDLTAPEYRKHLLLSDGGVYDNLGIETAWKRCRTLIVSDAAAQIQPQRRPARGWAGCLVRTVDVIDSQVRALRVRHAISGFQRGDRDGLYFGIRSHIDRYPVANRLPAREEHTAKLARIPTRLAPLAARTQEQLINWGYAICGAGLRRRLDGSLSPPVGFPYPESGIG